ncbi:hypothetical protein V8F20_008600 [Naviculisporaceae sp. PSN 640]
MSTPTTVPTPRGIVPINPVASVSDTATPLSVLPHILLFLVLILAFYPPPGPFHLRGVVVIVLVGILEWLCTVSPWPPNVGDTRPMKYGLASSWIFVLPVIQRLLISRPEKDFWRIDEGPNPGPPPKNWSFKKLGWSVSLFSSPRAVGWNFGSRKVNAQREEIRRARVALFQGTAGQIAASGSDIKRGELKFPRIQFVVTRLARAFGCYLLWDIVMLANQKVVLPSEDEWWSWDNQIMVRILWLEVLMGVTVWVGMNMQFDTAAADWPPLFGSILDCYTVANVWGKFWHQYMRQPCLGTSHFLLQHFNRLLNCLRLHQIPAHSLFAYFFHLITAFSISSFFHVLSLAGVATGYTPVRGIISNISLFFMVQPFAAVFESAVSAGYDRFIVRNLVRQVGGLKDRSSEEQGHDLKGNGQVHSFVDRGNANGAGDSANITPATTTATTSITPTTTPSTEDTENLIPQTDKERYHRRRHAVLFWSAVLGRAVGYLWVTFWFFLTGRWFLRPYIDVGITSWGLPISFADWLLLPDGCR